MNVTELGSAGLVRASTLIYRLRAMKPVLLPVCALLILLVSACGDSGRPAGQAGSTSKFVGGPCAEGVECEFTLCQTGSLTPGGTCTSSCFGDSNCSSGSSCAVTNLGWFCLVDCTSDSDCRTDYSCQQFTKAPAPEADQEPILVNVCAGNQ